MRMSFRGWLACVAITSLLTAAACGDSGTPTEVGLAGPQVRGGHSVHEVTLVAVEHLGELPLELRARRQRSVWLDGSDHGLQLRREDIALAGGCPIVRLGRPVGAFVAAAGERNYVASRYS
jgi:hypothetical protein